MTTPATEPTTIAQQRALVRAFRNSTQLWVDTQQQEGQRYKSNSQEHGHLLRQTNQVAQNQHSLIEQNYEQVSTALKPVALIQKLQEQAGTSFTPTIDDSTKRPAAELDASINTLAKLASSILYKAEVREYTEAEGLRIRHRNRKVAIVAISLLVLALIYAGYRIDQNNQQRIATETRVVIDAATRVAVETEQTRAAIEAEQARATLEAVKENVREIDGVTYIYIPAGEFIMGSENGDSDESPQHTVYLDEYWIMQTEVTNAQYRKFIEADGYTTEIYWSQDGWGWRTENEIVEPNCWDNSDFNNPQQPVVCVSWYEAEAYANWLSAESGLDFGLPTEAQWEKAARGTESRIYPWGNEWDGSLANYCDSNCTYDHADQETDDGYQLTAPVGSYPTGASPYGVLDMAGNVWEWMADWYSDDYYQSSPSRNPTGPSSGNRRVLRGGSWIQDPDLVRAADRLRHGPGVRYVGVGFRVWLSLSPD